MSAPAFYQLMARLEDADLISGWYESSVVSGQTIKERRYKITPAGKREYAVVQAFYTSRPDVILDETTYHTPNDGN